MAARMASRIPAGTASLAEVDRITTSRPGGPHALRLYDHHFGGCICARPDRESSRRSPPPPLTSSGRSVRSAGVGDVWQRRRLAGAWRRPDDQAHRPIATFAADCAALRPTSAVVSARKPRLSRRRSAFPLGCLRASVAGLAWKPLQQRVSASDSYFAPAPRPRRSQPTRFGS